MRKAEFEKYNEKINALTDVNEIQNALAANEQKIRTQSKYPTAVSLCGGWGSLALFLLTGLLSGWTLGVLWVVASIAGAGIISSAVAGIVGHFKYHRYFRALKTQERLAKIMKGDQNYSDALRMRLENRLNKDLAYCRRKRMISDREFEIRKNPLRPVVVNDGVLPQTVDEIKEEAERCNATMRDFKCNVEEMLTSDAGKFDSHKDNMSEKGHFEGAVVVSANELNEDGTIKYDESNNPSILKTEFPAQSDKDLARLLEGISKNFKDKLASGSLPLPVTIEVLDKEGNAINMAVENEEEMTKLVFGQLNRNLLEAEQTPLDIYAKNILEQLPKIDGANKDEEQHEEEQVEQQDEEKEGAERERGA